MRTIESDKILLKEVTDNIPYEVVRHLLVKPLEIKLVNKLTNSIIPDKFEDIIAEDGTKHSIPMSEAKEELVESMWIEAIILQIPPITPDSNFKNTYSVGDKVVVNRRSLIPFDLHKTTAFINPYDIYATVKPEA
jgi:hypothetical protein